MRVTRLEPFGLLAEAVRPSTLAAVGASQALTLLRAEPLVLFRGFTPPTRDEMLAFCRSFPGEGLLHWETGPVMEMTAAEDAKNYLFTREHVPLHWDGAFHREPSFLVFHCLQAPAADGGGETLFCDTERVHAGASHELRAAWDGISLTFETEKLAHYGGRVTGPLVRRHPRTGRPTLRFAEPVETEKNPVRLTVHGLANGGAARFIDDMRERAYDRRYCLAHRWAEGDILIADNHRLIHGRNAYSKESPRHLRRIQIL